MASSLFLILSPFLTWITIVSVVIYQGVVVFGAAAQSSLLMVSSDQLGTNISSLEALGAGFSVVLLVGAGLAMLKSPRLGVPLALAGLFAYLLPFYPIFGTQTSNFEQTFVSPGIGFFVAGMGIFLGLVSPADRTERLSALTHALRTREGLSKLGVFASSVGLALDVMNHGALGQLPDFVGLTPVQQLLHMGLVAGVSLLLISVIFRTRVNGDRYLLILSVATLALLGADAINSTLSGDLHDFLGHNLTETSLHLSVYYGVALTTVAGLLGLGRRN